MQKFFSSPTFWSWVRGGAAGLAPPPPHTWLNKSVIITGQPLCVHPLRMDWVGTCTPPPHGRGCNHQCGGTRLCLLRPTSVGTPLGVSTLTNKSHRSALPEGTPVGQKNNLKLQFWTKGYPVHSCCGVGEFTNQKIF